MGTLTPSLARALGNPSGRPGARSGGRADRVRLGVDRNAEPAVPVDDDVAVVRDAVDDAAIAGPEAAPGHVTDQLDMLADADAGADAGGQVTCPGNVHICHIVHFSADGVPRTRDAVGQEAACAPSNRDGRRRVGFRTRRLRTCSPAQHHYDQIMSQQEPEPGREREFDWEHWPGRRDPEEEGIRHRLRHLFTHSGAQGESAVEALIAERGRELELRTEQLAATVADLQRREERARELRTAVEEMLRHGSAELDERHAHLNGTAAQLAQREEAVAAAERELAERRTEVGAVELRRAALERREATIAERETALERIAATLHDRERELADREQQLGSQQAVAAVEEEPTRLETAHVVFAGGDRYRIAEVEGPAPASGDVITLDERSYVVRRLGASPFPGDTRRCAYAEPVTEHSTAR